MKSLRKLTVLPYLIPGLLLLTLLLLGAGCGGGSTPSGDLGLDKSVASRFIQPVYGNCLDDDAAQLADALPEAQFA